MDKLRLRGITLAGGLCGELSCTLFIACRVQQGAFQSGPLGTLCGELLFEFAILGLLRDSLCLDLA